MYVYKQTEPSLWTVGFYDPSGKWEAESDHTSEDAAAQRVHWLNGGTKVRMLAAVTSTAATVTSAGSSVGQMNAAPL